MSKKPFVTKEQVEEIVKTYPTPFHLYDEKGIRENAKALNTVSKGVEEYQKDKKGALLIITHSTRILESLHVDKTHVLVNGKIVASGDAALVDEINEHGFERFLEA